MNGTTPSTFPVEIAKNELRRLKTRFAILLILSNSLTYLFCGFNRKVDPYHHLLLRVRSFVPETFEGAVTLFDGEGKLVASDIFLMPYSSNESELNNVYEAKVSPKDLPKVILAMDHDLQAYPLGISPETIQQKENKRHHSLELRY